VSLRDLGWVLLYFGLGLALVAHGLGMLL